MLVLKHSIRRGMLTAFGAALMLSGCDLVASGQTFDIAAPEAKRLLMQTEVPYDVLGNPALRSMVNEKEPSVLVWTVKLDGVELMQFSAELTAKNAQSTHVLVSLTGPATGPNVAMGKALNDNITVKKLYLAAMEEEIAATLEKRDFDIMKITPELLAATAANLNEITGRFDRDVAAGQQSEEDVSDRDPVAAELSAWNAETDEAAE